MIVSKKISDEKMISLKNTFIKRSQIDTILDKDATVYTEDGKLLFVFKKKQLTGGQDFYTTTSNYVKSHPSRNRGSSSGSTFYNINENPKINTAIIGYYDKWAPNQKKTFRLKQMKPSIEARETYFTSMYPEKFKQLFPYIHQIDALYKTYLPEYYKKQVKKANETYYKIDNTAFTTVTININYQTTIHKDKGDDEDGFGNLSVIEHGNYTGGEICFPQYGVGVNLREGDILFMNVHEWHANLPMKFEKGAERMSVVCYLRKKVWERTRGKSLHYMQNHTKKVKRVLLGV
jgi:hypothetical protein